MKHIIFKSVTFLGICLFAVNNMEAGVSVTSVKPAAINQELNASQITQASDRNPELNPDWLSRVKQGIADHEYHAGFTEKGLQAPNRAHNLRIYFDHTGIHVTDRTTRGNPKLIDLRPSSLGRGESIEKKFSKGVVSHEKNRVEITHAGFTEWYINSPEGLEQGFTIFEKPEGNGPLHLTLAVSHAKARQTGDNILLTTPTHRKLQYKGLDVKDAEGVTLPAHMIVPGPDQIVLIVNDTGAKYPVEIDPLLTTAADAVIESNQSDADMGFSVSSAGDVNGDGYDDVIVGALWYDNGELDEGAAFVFHGSAAGITGSDPSNADAMIESNQDDANMGDSVASAGDVNGDGYDDIIVAGRAAFIFHGSALGITGSDPSNADATLGMGINAVASAGDVNGDGYGDIVIGAFRHDNGEIDEGAAFVFHGSASGITGSDLLTADAVLESNQDNAWMGASVASAGDVNGDGYDDVIVGAPEYGNGENGEGAAFVFHGSASGITGADPSTAHAVLESNQDDANMGWSVASAGDVNGDGYDDVIVGAPEYGNGENGEGAAFIFLGSASGITGSDPSTAHALLESNQTESRIVVASAGDVNGDGYGDVIVGAPFYDISKHDDGAAFVFLGSASGITGSDPSDADAVIKGNHIGAATGCSVASAGDVNGDGYDDVIVGAFMHDNGEHDEGMAFIFHGSAAGLTGTDTDTSSVAGSGLSNADAVIESNQAAANMGWSVASAGDINGDGYGDIIVGVHNYDNGDVDEGAAFIFHGSAAGITAADPSSANAMIEGNEAYACMGWSVSSAGDVNGDGYDDVVVGKSYYSPFSLGGAAFVFLGSPSGIVGSDPSTANAVIEDIVYERLGESVASAGDVNGDGYDDVIVGVYNGSSYSFSSKEPEEGVALIFLGSALGITASNPSDADTVLESNQAGAFLGISVASAGDVNGDGYDDVIVGAPLYDMSGINGGAAFIFMGSASGIIGTDPSTAGAVLASNQTNAYMGISVASAGDVNGDGYDDVIVGAYYYTNGETGEGAAFVFQGSASGITGSDPSNADAMLESNQAEAWMGWSVSGAGDMNNDGYDDVIVGARFYDNIERNEGSAFIYYGSASGITGSNPLDTNIMLESNQAGASMGVCAASAGDINGDGYDDVIIGADHYSNSESSEGAAFIYYGSDITNAPPVADAQSVTIDEDTTDNPIVLTGSDADGDSLTFTVTTGPENGTLSGTPPDFYYTPDPDYFGTDTFTFDVNDGYLDSAEATVTITVNNIDDPPVADAQSITIDEDTTDNPIVLTGSDADGDSLTFTVTSEPENGTINGTPPDLYYTPNPGYYGIDTFTFSVNDGDVSSADAAVTITVNHISENGGGTVNTDDGGDSSSGCFISRIVRQETTCQ